MRKIINLHQPIDGIVRLMIHTLDNDEATYLFGFNTMEDYGGMWDSWFEFENDALEYCEMEYGVPKSDWVEIPNPEPHCQQDFISSVRVKGREVGKPEFGKLEKLINGEWVEFKIPNKR